MNRTIKVKELLGYNKDTLDNKCSLSYVELEGTLYINYHNTNYDILLFEYKDGGIRFINHGFDLIREMFTDSMIQKIVYNCNKVLEVLTIPYCVNMQKTQKHVWSFRASRKVEFEKNLNFMIAGAV